MLKEVTFTKTEIKTAGKPGKVSGEAPFKAIRTLYRANKWAGLLAFTVVLIWLFSSLVTLVGSQWFRTEIAKSEVSVTPISSEYLGKSLQEVMEENNLKSLRNFRYVDMDDKKYIQIKDTYNRLRYYEVNSGKKLTKGDQLYAAYLARYFTGDWSSAITLALVERFDEQYSAENRLLPVYKVSFHNSDATDVYVETEQSRLAAANTYTQRVLSNFTNIFPNGLWAGNAKFTVPGMVLLVFLMLVALTGFFLYALQWKPYKAAFSFNNYRQPAKHHRKAGLVFSLLLFAFAASGALHLFVKSNPDDSIRFIKNSVFTYDELKISTAELPWEATKAYNASVIGMPQGIFYQLFSKKENGQLHTDYINAATGEMLADGDLIYARYLANKFKAHKAKIDAGVSFSCCIPPDTIPDGTQLEEAGIMNTTHITDFNKDYDFANKRLPVVKVAYKSPIQLTYFIETASSRQAIRSTTLNRLEAGISSLFHADQLSGAVSKNTGTAGLFVALMALLFISLSGSIYYLKL